MTGEHAGSWPVWVVHSDAVTFTCSPTLQAAHEAYVAAHGDLQVAVDRVAVPVATIGAGPDAVREWLGSWLAALYTFYRGPNPTEGTTP